MNIDNYIFAFTLFSYSFCALIVLAFVIKDEEKLNKMKKLDLFVIGIFCIIAIPILIPLILSSKNEKTN